MDEVISLKDACFYFIVENVTGFSPESLALLPRHVRNRLIPFLPAVDLWRLENCPAFTDGMEFEEVWKERVATHITAWEPAHRLEAEREKTARETYLYYVTLLLLFAADQYCWERVSDFHDCFEQKPSQMPSQMQRQRRYDMHVRASFRLKRTQLKCPADMMAPPELVEKDKYVYFLLHGIHMKEIPSLLNFAVCPFDSRKEYFVHHHYIMGRKWCPLLQLFMQCCSWTPKKLKVISPTGELNQYVTKFLSSVEKICVVGFTDMGVLGIVQFLTAVFRPGSGLSPTRLVIEAKYHHQLTWLLPKLSTVCGSLAGQVGYSSLRHITISTLDNQQSKGPVLDWSRLLFQERIESIKLVKLKTNVQLSLLYALRLLTVTRPSLRSVNLIDCSFSEDCLAQLVADFLSTPTSHPQSLLIRQWQPPSYQDLEKMKRQEPPPDVMSALSQLPKPSYLCPSKDNKTLCLPFLANGPCSLPWILGFQLLSLELTLDLRVNECNNRLGTLLTILNTTQCSIPVGSITVTVEAKSPSTAEQSCARVICDLAMCSAVNEVRIVQA